MMNDARTSDLERWLRTTGQTIDTEFDAPRALTERLRFVAQLLADIGSPVVGPALALRTASGLAIAVPIDGELVVGRETPAKLVLDDRRLSKQHFRIRLADNGPILEDLKSRNGTYVNGVKTRQCLLRDGNIIEAGSHVFVFLDRMMSL